MHYMIGIDDTDKEGSADTGALALQLGLQLEKNLRAHMLSITAHRLFDSPSLHATHQNRCVCLLMEVDSTRRREVELICRQFLLRESAPSANPGFALARWSEVDASITDWGRLAQHQKLDRLDALVLARKCSISAAGLTGSGNGVIGALAAIGLYFDGNDGHYLWLPGLSELKGILKAVDVLQRCDLSRMENRYGRAPMPNDRIFFPGEVHPLVRDSRSLLLLQAAPRGEAYEWISQSANSSTA